MCHYLQQYELPLVYADLTQAETIKDALYAIKIMTKAIDNIFDRVDIRITEEKKRLTTINKRVENCLTRVRQIKGTNKATTIFSTAKFPAGSIQYYSTLISVSNIPLPSYREAGDEQYFPASVKRALVGNAELNLETLTIMSRLNSYGTDMERVEFIIEDQGLGTLPEYVSSVGSLLLFNSSINLYKDYQTQDNLESSGRIRVGEEESKKALASAPTTILSGDALPDIDALDLSFKPVMEEMTSLALPANLPLDFLADIQYSGIPLPSIAPSSQSKGSSSASFDVSYSSGPRAKEGRRESVTSMPPPPAPMVSMPPPPPPGINVAPVQPPPVGVKPPPPPVVNHMPPPPPPSARPPPPPPKAAPIPPPPANISSSAIEDVENDDMNTDNSVGGFSFLDGIKGMSVEKLRSREESQLQVSKFQKKEDAKKPLSLQDDLRARLQRRHGAISGKSDKEQQARDALIVQAARNNQLSSQLSAPNKPPPPPLASKSKPMSTLKSVGFAAVNDSDNDSDSPRMQPRLSVADHDGFSDSDEASISDISLDSVATPPKPASKPLPLPPMPMKQPEPQAPSAQEPERRVSILDASAATVTSMISKAQKQKSGSDSDDTEWD